MSPLHVKAEGSFIKTLSQSNNEVDSVNWSPGNDYLEASANGTFLSSTNISTERNGGFFTTDSNQPGEITSNILNLGDFRAWLIGILGLGFSSEPGQRVSMVVRSGNSISETQNATWINYKSYSNQNHQYLQWKATISIYAANNSAEHFAVAIYGASRAAWGQVVDSKTNRPIENAVATSGTTSEKVFYAAHNGSGWGVMSSIVENTHGWYRINIFQKSSGNSLIISAPGYQSQTVNFNSDFFTDKSMYRKDFKLVASSSSQSTSTRSIKNAPTTPTKPILFLSTTSRVGANNQPVTLDNATPVSILPTQKLTFSGTTSANAKVTLTIKSDPITKEVTADASGAWRYTLDPKELALETGEHTVTAIATDTKGVPSDSVELAKFTLKEASTPAPTPEPYKFKAKDLLTPVNYVLGGVLILLIGGLIFIIVRRKKVCLKINQKDLYKGENNAQL